MRRFLPFLTIGLISIAGLIFSLSEPHSTVAEFVDVGIHHPAHDAVSWAAEADIMHGYFGDTYFDPDKLITRAEFTKIVVASEFSEQETLDCISRYYAKSYWYVFFPDVPTDSWFAKYVCLAHEYAFIQGRTDGNFYPDENVSLAEAAKILANAFGENISTRGSVWYAPYVKNLTDKNVVPKSISTFRSALKRSEVAEILYRLKNEITDRSSQSYAALEANNFPCDQCLVIPRLSIQAPVIFGPGEDALYEQDWKRLDREILKALENGVVHYPGTALPGQKGNNFITGHSSYYNDAAGKYKDIFAKLSELTVGDTYEVYYNGSKYEYRIRESKIVLPTDVSVLYQPHDEEISTLMTCWPVYTNLKRQIFVAERLH